MTNNNTQNWVKAALDGEEQAWNFLYQEYYPRLYATALQICGNFADAKDMVQDSFMTAWLSLSQLKNSNAFGAWLKTILMRNCYQWLDKNKQKKKLDSILILSDQQLENELEQKLDNLFMQKRLVNILTHLSETLRTSLLLRYFSSFQSYNQIAEILAIPLGTVRSRLNEGKSKLAEKWREPLNDKAVNFSENNEWSSFYNETYFGSHHHDDCKIRLYNHFEKNIQIIFLGKPHIGIQVLDNLLIEDRRVGSWITPINVMSLGTTSIFEVKHINSPEYPDHCHPASVVVLNREKNRANKMSIYF